MEVGQLRQLLLDEVFKALGLLRFPYLCLALKPLFSPAVQRFAELAVAFDRNVALKGFSEAARRVLPVFAEQVYVQIEAPLPEEGALLVVSNHPGLVDSLVLASRLPRKDLRVVASGVPFLRHLKATAGHLIYSSLDTFERAKTLRAVIRHLQNGGTVLIFPGGRIEPDPLFMPGAEEELENWSPSIEVIIRHVPNLHLVVSAVSGVLNPAWMRNPFVRLRRGRLNQQRTAEFLQVIQQMLSPKSPKPSPRASLSAPLRLPEKVQVPILPWIVELARERIRLVAQTA
ncbi:MAG: 1-acyl-sn-glycerol-3-phosphate acyltransferase [Anaerolineales bacterium]|nr:1-acyl-sn-glycerol-3-phosphate acyltransferase [Anaerolineales bacterium]MCS7247705.1 1-acyl-sn-glycerol-3-phosphate acyltransferase [Anaerolineales bacterium]MDW8161515.1 1-acyl-sn-glycerol-3-phosphate acyltransferase [Anaerolineales bacterium]MDW8446851.1 1-acyl-sn-glycerol-3-phosphate acyltransferase [Anaerolineales bacterium]